MKSVICLFLTVLILTDCCWASDKDELTEKTSLLGGQTYQKSYSQLQTVGSINTDFDEDAIPLNARALTQQSTVEQNPEEKSTSKKERKSNKIRGPLDIALTLKIILKHTLEVNPRSFEKVFTVEGIKFKSSIYNTFKEEGLKFRLVSKKYMTLINGITIKSLLGKNYKEIETPLKKYETIKDVIEGVYITPVMDKS